MNEPEPYTDEELESLRKYDMSVFAPDCYCGMRLKRLLATIAERDKRLERTFEAMQSIAELRAERDRLRRELEHARISLGSCDICDGDNPKETRVVSCNSCWMSIKEDAEQVDRYVAKLARAQRALQSVFSVSNSPMTSELQMRATICAIRAGTQQALAETGAEDLQSFGAEWKCAECGAVHPTYAEHNQHYQATHSESETKKGHDQTDDSASHDRRSWLRQR